MTLRGQNLVALALVAFLVRAAFAMALVPPWQHPDEPQHFEAVRTVAGAPRLDFARRADPAVERDIFESMAAYGWWRHVGLEVPVAVPHGFAEDPYFMRVQVQGALDAPPVYYAVAGTVVRLLGLDDLLAQFYAARALSVLFGVLTILAVYSGTQRLLGSPEAATGAAALLALHPQFVLTATAANPDALVNLLAAVIYWQLARLVSGERAFASFGVVLIASVAAVFTKRSGAPLLVVAGLAAVWLLVLTMRRGARHLLAGVFLVGVALVAGFALVWFGGAEVARLAREWSHVARAPLEANPLSPAFLWTFGVTLVRSAWLWFGWMAYPAPDAWMVLPWLVTAGAIGGAVLAFLRTPDAAVRRGLVAAGLFVLIQVGAVLVTFYARGRLAQGRYLFPAIGPWLVLVWVGVGAWFPVKWRRTAGVLLVAAFFLLDGAAWWLYIVPTYAR